MEAIARMLASEEEENAQDALKNEEHLCHDQSRPVTAGRRNPSEVADKAPNANDERDQEPRVSDPLVNQQDGAQEATGKASAAAIAASSVSREFLKLIARRASAGANHRASSTSESCGWKPAWSVSSTR